MMKTLTSGRERAERNRKLLRKKKQKKKPNCERGEGAEFHLCQALSRNPGEVQQLSSETLPQLSLHQLLSLHPVTAEFTE